jgi:hypothetical protein
MTTDNSNIEYIRLKELDIDMIQPTTADYKKPDQGGQKTIVVGKPGTGKCLAPGTLVMMFDGSFKKVENVVLGDLLMGDDSTPRTVLSTCHGRDIMYEIRQKNGDNYIVNEPHILSLKHNKNIYDISVKDLIQQTKKIQRDCQGYKVGVEFPAKNISSILSPYVWGFLSPIDLKSVSEKIRVNGNIFNQEEIREIENLSSVPDNYRYYIYNERRVRLELLAGILDSSAVYDKRGGHFDLTYHCENYINNFVFLARSLGFSVERRRVCSGTEKFWRCRVSGDIHTIPFRIFSVKPKVRKIDYLSTKISIHCLGEGEYYGFQLDGNHRFLLGDFTVTHNTTLISSLLYSKKHIFPVAMVMSGTEDSNHFYRSVLPSTFVFNNYDEEQIEKFVKRQKIAKEHVENPWAIMILDDCTDDPALFRKPLQNGLYKRGRHWKMWYILSLQYGMDVRPVIRTNVDGVFILREPNMRNRRVMYENYASIIPDFKLFCDILDQITNDYTALYIHNATKSNDWRDCVFWYKAKPIPPDFKFGSEDYWNFHYERYNPDYVDPITI